MDFSTILIEHDLSPEHLVGGGELKWVGLYFALDNVQEQLNQLIGTRLTQTEHILV